MTTNTCAISTLQVKLSQGDHTGWIDIHLCTDDVELAISASDVFSPFQDLAEFLENVIGGRMPCECEVDEEGVVKRLNAMPLENLLVFQFRLCDGDEPSAVFIDRVFDRRQFVSAFYDELVDFIATRYRADKWTSFPVDDLKRLDLEKLKSLLIAAS